MNISKKTIQELAVEHKARPRAERSIRVLLDNVRSGHNVGAIFRTSDALAIEKVYLSGICPKPPHKEIRKSAIGAEQEVSWEYVSQDDVIDALKILNKRDLPFLLLNNATSPLISMILRPLTNHYSSSVTKLMAYILSYLNYVTMLWKFLNTESSIV